MSSPSLEFSPLSEPKTNLGGLFLAATISVLLWSTAVLAVAMVYSKIKGYW